MDPMHTPETQPWPSVSDATSEELYRAARDAGDEAVRWMRHARRFPADEDRAVLLASYAASLYHLAVRTQAEEDCPACQVSGGPHTCQCASHPDYEPTPVEFEHALARKLSQP